MPSASRDDAVLLWCDLKAVRASSRLLSIERFRLVDGKPQIVDTLIVPEKPEVPVSTARTDKFFLDLQGGSGYLLRNRELLTTDREWLRIDGFLASLPLVDLSFLLRLFFPTIIAADLRDYETAFRIAAGTPSPAALARLIEVVGARARELPTAVARPLRTVFRGLPQQYQAWWEQVGRPAAPVEYEIDPAAQISLDRFENLTSGASLTANDLLLLFADDNRLRQAIDGYEPRKGQAKYVQAVLKTLEQRTALLLEAATGTGKSIGYLLPTIAACQEHDARAVIVTRTKSLQEQLFRSDLRKIRSLIPDGFRISLLKGLANYLCLLKYKIFISDLAELMGRIPAELMAALIVWEHFTESGDLTETEIFDQPDSEQLLAKITLDEGACLGKDCQFYNDCYAFRARKNAARSSTVITNYALLFSDLVGGGDILGRFAYAIFDEAHRLENEAINAFAESLPLLVFARSLERLTDEKSMVILRQAVGDDDGDLLGFTNLVSRLHARLTLTAEAMRRELKPRATGGQDRVRIKSEDPLHDLLCDLWLTEHFQFQQVRDVVIKLQQGASAVNAEDHAEALTLLRRTTNGILKCIAFLERLPKSGTADDVMWATVLDSGDVWVTIAPLKVGELMAQRLYARYDAVVMTSATLDSEDNFEWIARRLGLTEELGHQPYRVKIRSPFPLHEQLRLVLARYLPPPTAPEYTPRLVNLIMRFRSAAKLPTLVLCTSYRMVDEIARPLLAEPARAGDVLVQTPETLPQTLLNRFKQLRSAILIGTESFWEGIDLPDELLRLLFITRLPFAVPDDPLELARQELAEQRGENPFMTISLPQAVLKYRQGLGRMIRSATDWGAVIITDSRMARKSYGQILVAASPVDVHVADNEGLLVTETAAWLRQKRDTEISA